nr:WYL domain-containing protein [uncultured Sulfurimonas sp.]
MAKKDYDKTLRRLTQILSKLSYDERPNTRELAEEFGVSVRTIQKDIKDNLCEFPILKDFEGRFMFQEGFSLNRTVLDSDEMMFLKIALSQFDDVKNIDKIKHRIFQKLANNSFYNPYFIKQDDIEDLNIDSIFVERLEKFIKNQEILELTLTNKIIEIEAYKIANYDGFWYLFAKDLSDGRVKTFKLSQIKKINSINKYYKTSQKIIEETLKKTHSAFYDDGNCFEVLIKVDKDAAIYFKSKDFLQSQKILEESIDGSLKISFEVSHDEDIDNIIKSWLPHVEVLEPKRFRDKLLNELKIYLQKVKKK